MKKVIIPFNKDALPPLMLANDLQAMMQAPVLNSVTPVVLDPDNRGNSALGSPSKASGMRLVQTASGKKILLTNVTTSKLTSNGQFLLLSNSLSPSPTVVQSPAFSAVPTSKSQTLLMSSASSSSTGGKTLRPMIHVPGFSNPLIMKQDTLAIMKAETSMMKVKEDLNNSDISAPAVIPVHLLNNPITGISTSNTGMYINNGFSRFKVVGKPVPVTLGKSPVPVTLSKSPVPVTLGKSPVKIAPKNMRVRISEERSSSPQPRSPSKYVEPLQSPQLDESSPNSIGSVPSPQSGSPLKSTASSTPPAYLNIQVKDEPEEDTETKIKLEEDGPMSILDVRIKEEPSDDQR